MSQRPPAPPRARRPRPLLAAVGRAAAVAALAGTTLLSPGAPAAAQATDGLDGDTYTSDEFGWSVTFDDRVWTAEEVDERTSQGVSLSGDGTFANIVVYDDGIDDAQGCLDDLAGAFTSSSDWDGLAPARTLDAPETAGDAVGELYTGALALDDGSIDLALYLECREVEGATLSITVTAIEESYEDQLPDLEELLAGIATGGSSNGGDPTPEDDDPSPNGPVSRRTPTTESDDPTPGEDTPAPDEETPTAEAEDPTPVAGHGAADQLGAEADGTLDEGSYRSELGYALTWDSEAFDGVAGDDPGAGILLESPDTNATLEVAVFEDPAIEDCIAAEVARVLESPDYVSAARSNSVRPPISADEAVGRVLRATEDTTRQDRKIIYVECRPLGDVEGEDGDPVFLVVRAVSDDEEFRANRVLFEDVLATIATGDEPVAEPTKKPTAKPTKEATAAPEDEPTPRPRRTPTAEPADEPTDLGETDIPGGVYVGSQFPVKVAWDTAYWEVEEITAQGIEGISIVSDQGAFGRILTVAATPDFGVAECLATQISGWSTDQPDLAQVEPTAAQELAFPTGTEPVYAVGTFAFDDGSTATLVSAAGCLGLGDGAGFLIMSVQIFDAVYADNAAAFDQVLGSIEVGTVGGQVGLLGRAAPADPRVAAAAPNRIAVLDD